MVKKFSSVYVGFLRYGKDTGKGVTLSFFDFGNADELINFIIDEYYKAIDDYPQGMVHLDEYFYFEFKYGVPNDFRWAKFTRDDHLHKVYYYLNVWKELGKVYPIDVIIRILGYESGLIKGEEFDRNGYKKASDRIEKDYAIPNFIGKTPGDAIQNAVSKNKGNIISWLESLFMSSDEITDVIDTYDYYGDFYESEKIDYKLLAVILDEKLHFIIFIKDYNRNYYGFMSPRLFL